MNLVRTAVFALCPAGLALGHGVLLVEATRCLWLQFMLSLAVS